ncbi:neuropeptides capa receptor [Coccinella septempunctata]|uniref:neuropeptides capa receptor n=1 Tax=Coccinella septempunctata TaxID=41139 RepID=UPI001D075A56|nr:neuropeptides capa receptor [Coccinella septempunctata]
MESTFSPEDFYSWTSLVETFQFYYIPILVCLGTVGNSISVYVFFHSKKMRHLSSSYYLSALAVSDTLFLLSIFMVWLRFFEIDVFNNEGTCQALIYISAVCSFLSVWLVVAFTLERFIAVKYPLNQRSVWTVARAKLVILSLVVFAIILYIPLVYLSAITDHSGTSICGIQPELADLAIKFNYIDTFLTYVAPVTIITFLNIWIGKILFHFTKIRRGMTMRGSRFGKASDSLKLKYANTISQKSITKMLLMVSTVFLCFNFPSYILRIVAYLIEVKAVTVYPSYTLQQLQQWCQLLFYTNFGINFILYCVSGKNFRRALKNLLKIKRPQRSGKSEIIVLTDSRVQSSGSSLASIRRKLNFL